MTLDELSEIAVDMSPTHELLAWEAAIETRLVARLIQRLCPGLIRQGLARRITGAIESIAGRLPLLARFPRVAERNVAAATTIVHVAWPGAPRDGGDPAGSRVAAVAPPALPIVAARATVFERVIERTVIERVATATPAPVLRPEPATAPVSPDAPPRRSRMGAPLAITPASPAARSSAPPVTHLASTRPPIVPVAVAARRSSAVADAVVVASRQPATLVASAVPHRAARLAAPAATVEAAPAIVVPLRAKSRLAAPAAVIAAASRAPAGHAPLVTPRTAPGSASRSIESPLAHVAAAPVSAAGSATTPSPRSVPPTSAIATTALATASLTASPRAGVTAPTSRGVPLSRADLPEIAAQVQHILSRQAAHERARRGLRR